MTTVAMTEQAPTRRRTAEERLADAGLADWAALRTLAEFCGPGGVVAAQCKRLDEAGVDAALHNFLSQRSGRRPSSRTFPEYLADEDDLWVLARHALEVFVHKGLEGLFLGTYSGSSYGRAYTQFEKLSDMLGGDAARRIVASLDQQFGRKRGDSWEVYKYSVNLPWPKAPDLEAIERYSRSIPEDQWGGNDVYGLTSDLEATLRAALEEKRTGRPEPPARAAVPADDEAWLRELELMDGGGEALGR